MKMFDCQFGETSSPATNELTAALAKAQLQFPSIELDGDNTHLRARYATYQQCAASLRKPLNENGFSLPQFSPCYHDTLGWVCVGVLRHSSGQFVTGTAPILMSSATRKEKINGKETGAVIQEPPTMQTFGASLTYAKRQLLLALTGAWVGEVDDDGEADRQTQQVVQSAVSAEQQKQAASDKLEAMAVQKLQTLNTREERAAFAMRTAEHLSAKRLTQAAADRIAALIAERNADAPSDVDGPAKKSPASQPAVTEVSR